MPGSTLEKKQKKGLPSQQLGLIVSSRVNLRDIRSTEFSAKSAPDADTNLTISIRSNVNTELLQNNDNKNSFIKCLIHLELLGKRNSDVKDEDASLCVRSVFCLFYDITDTEGILQEHLNNFGENNGVFNVWPYWREYVQAATVRLGLPPLTLPTYHF